MVVYTFFFPVESFLIARPIATCIEQLLVSSQMAGSSRSVRCFYCVDASAFAQADEALTLQRCTVS